MENTLKELAVALFPSKSLGGEMVNIRCQNYAGRLIGELLEDEKGRFPPGTTINTSPAIGFVFTKMGLVIETLNTIYYTRELITFFVFECEVCAKYVAALEELYTGILYKDGPVGRTLSDAISLLKLCNVSEEDKANGPLTDAQLRRIDEVNTCNDISEGEVVNRLF